LPVLALSCTFEFNQTEIKMLELIIDTCSAEERAREVLRAADIGFADHNECINVVLVEDCDKDAVEAAMAKAEIEIQWMGSEEDE
jgi:hypothetical protein